MDMDVDSQLYDLTQPQEVEAADIPQPSLPPQREAFRDIPVKVHRRGAERDTWVYQGKGIVSQEVTGHSSRIVVRSVSSGKTFVVFSEHSELQAEKRGNFIVIGCVNGPRVESWSLNPQNHSETLRLLAGIELACYKPKQVSLNTRMIKETRRRIEKIIKDDRRKRHRRRKEQDAMVDAFARSHIEEEVPPDANAPEDTPQPS